MNAFSQRSGEKRFSSEEGGRVGIKGASIAGL